MTGLHAVPPRFELRQAEPKSAVLPLHHGTNSSGKDKIKIILSKNILISELLNKYFYKAGSVVLLSLMIRTKLFLPEIRYFKKGSLNSY
jgi:hypothetical protein